MCIGPLNVDLDEGSRQLFFFPRRGRFAGAKADDHIIPSRRLARMERDVADNSIALVEDPEDRDALRHRSHGLALRKRASFRSRNAIGDLIGLIAAAIAGRKRDQRARQQDARADHPYSGIQGS